ncbi:hypothetical protein V1503_18965 [Bacillus sp. SCS-151]|uniref:hypothetical protein n=1 Tax=Nanhaiella sioensis TaxID=3115293 RepID=UPI00397B3FC0
MNEYFDHIISKMSFRDISILGILHDNGANVVFKAITRRDLKGLSNLSEAKFRETLIRLEANGFINIVGGNKDHRIYINEYGQLAINESLKGEIVE